MPHQSSFVFTACCPLGFRRTLPAFLVSLASPDISAPNFPSHWSSNMVCYGRDPAATSGYGLHCAALQAAF